VALFCGAFAVACAPRARGERLPPGTLLAGDAAPVAAVLQALQGLPESGLVRFARELEAALEPCERFRWVCPPGGNCEAREDLECLTAREGAEIEGLLEGSNWVFSHALGADRWLVARGRATAGGAVAVEATLPTLPELPRLGLLLPAREGPGGGHLSLDEALLHARVRADGGLDLAALLSPEGLSARLYGLRSQLFLDRVLAGTWELAVYLPAEGQRIPPTALALDVLDRPRAEAALDRFLDEIAATWPVRRDPYRLGAWEGACLSNLRVLPDLEPCYVATERAVVMGWNRSSVEKALASPPPAASQASRFTLFLSRLPEADRRLAAASGAAGPGFIAYPWDLALLTGERGAEGYRLRLELTAEEGP
jgi:hypothetical protein